MRDFQRILQLLLLPVLLHCTACGEDVNGQPESADACTPDPDRQRESCWVNDKELIEIDELSDFDPICQSKCTKIEAILISGVDHLQDLSPLQQITHIGALTLRSNPDLRNVEHLSNLQGGMELLAIRSNSALESLSGLESVSNLPYGLFIEGNPTLRSIEGLENLEVAGGEKRNGVFQIMGNENLEEVGGLDNLKRIIGHLNIQNNKSLRRLNGLKRLERIHKSLYIGGNPELRSIESLKSLRKLEGRALEISQNPTLPHCQAYSLKNQLVNFMGRTRITGNAPCEDD